MPAKSPSRARRVRDGSVALGAAGVLLLSSTFAASASPTPEPKEPATGSAPAPQTGPGVPQAAAEVLSAGRARHRECHARRVSARSTDGFAVTATSTGLVRVRLTEVKGEPSGDWDVAVFDSSDGRVVAASAGPSSHELADGFVEVGRRLWIQGCRYAGRADRVGVAVDFVPTPPPSAAGAAQLVSVATPRRSDKTRLLGLGLDVTESGDAGHVDVVLRDERDAARLRDAGLRYSVRIKDLRKHLEKVRRADRAYARSTAESGLPSGRTSYRRLADYDYEMKELARRHPRLVKLDVLPERSFEGRDITGVEITRHPKRVRDGKPIFLNLGVHHAREWPSGEHALEFAYDLVKGYAHDARTRRLVRATRTIVVPIVNPDGFSVSREATPRGDFSQFDYENKRKNCDPVGAPDPALLEGPCPVNPAGVDRGVDLNRNYGAFWGGPGASPIWSSGIYRGPSPFSEPETRAVRELVSRRQVTNLITNHTFGNLVLRPPGVLGTGQPVDAPLLASLGRAFTSHNRYANFLSFQLYDTSGTTDDWSYWIAGALSYTFEIGPDFHPAFEDGVVAEYLGRSPAAGAGRGGNREAYYAMLESTARKSDHATLTGKAPRGSTLRVRKQFQTPTSPVLNEDGTTGPARLVADTLDSTFRARGGRFSWAVNPSTRPYVAGRYGRAPVAPPQQAVVLTNPPGQPAENVGDPLSGPREESTFTIQGPPAADNGSAKVRVQWTNPADDWDVYVLDDQGSLVAQAASYGADYEEATLLDPLPGTYRVVVVNYDQADDSAPFDDWTGSVSFDSPKPGVEGVREAWTLTCERPHGSIAAVRQVIVERGETVDLGAVCRRQKLAAAAVRR